MPTANTLVRWVNENAFAPIVRARPCPTFGRPVHRRGSPHRLRPGTSPHTLRIPPHGGHPVLRSNAESGFRFTLAVSSYRFRARLGFSIPSLSSPASEVLARFWIQRPSSERRRDFNPPEQCAAQRTLRIGPPLRSASVLEPLRGLRSSHSIRIGAPGSHVPHESLSQARATYLPVTVQPVNRLPPDLSQAAKSARFR